MNPSTKKTLYKVLGILIVFYLLMELRQFPEGRFGGLIDWSTGEATGYNLSTIIGIGLGIFFIVSGFKKTDRSSQNQTRPLHESTSNEPDPDFSQFSNQPFSMRVEDVFLITGRGTVATGQIQQGMVRVNDELEVANASPPRKVVVTGIEAFRKILTQAKVGDNVGLMLKGIEREGLKQGDLLVSPK